MDVRLARAEQVPQMILAVAALTLAVVSADASVLRTASFSAGQAGEAVASLTASCRPCDWGRAGQEAAVLVLRLDGRYSQHLPLVRGQTVAEYRVGLGPLDPGPHRLEVAVDGALTPKGVATDVDRLEVEVVGQGEPAHRVLAHAPVVHLRPGSLERFTDVPLLMWHEEEKTARGARLRYSVVFSHEDGGTPTDRLMATWGRTTDIEMVYEVELDGVGRVLDERFQGREHRIEAFTGRRQGRHPLLWVVTDNNMVADRGDETPRVAPAPVPFPEGGVGREAVMDAHAWTYQVTAGEVRREGRVSNDAAPGSGRIPDPGRFVYLEACAELEDATLAFDAGVAQADGRLRWHASDAGGAAFRIRRGGCVRSAIDAPAAPGERLARIRVRALARPVEPPEREAPGRARVTRIVKLFRLGPDALPGPSLLEWSGSAVSETGGAPLELALERR